MEKSKKKIIKMLCYLKNKEKENEINLTKFKKIYKVVLFILGKYLNNFFQHLKDHIRQSNLFLNWFIFTYKNSTALKIFNWMKIYDYPAVKSNTYIENYF